MQFFTGRALCFVFWLPWLPVKLLETVQPLPSAIGQREIGPKKYVKHFDQIDEQHIVHHLQYQLLGSKVSLIFTLSKHSRGQAK